MKRTLLIFSFALFLIPAQAQQKPKLVVGIVVDQMRQEYLYRFEKKFGDGGFKRLMKDGFMLKNAHYNYVPTYTGPGHASIYTGTTPAIHGIIGNDWYDKQFRKEVNCVGDERQKVVGHEVGNGDVSPWRLLSSTVTDELKLATQKHAKVIGLSMKDRGAVLPAGHMADGAYWFDSPSGKFISSTYYKPGLPTWLDRFNARKLPDQYLSMEWKPLLPIADYVESGPDDTPYEARIRGGEVRPVFPYKLKEMRGQSTGYEILVATPFGSDLIFEALKAAIEGEELGKDDVTDFLAVSFSSPDYIGHAMGPNSIEIEDAYLRLDKNLADLLTELDAKVGAGSYTVFLTSDHAVADNPQFMKDNKMPAGFLKVPEIEAGLNDYLKKYFPDRKVIERISNSQIYLNPDVFVGDPKASGIDWLVATEIISRYLMSLDGIAEVYSAPIMKASDYNSGGVKGMMVRGYNHKRSGDILLNQEPGWMSLTSSVGTTHGSAYTYDTHIPIIFFGNGIMTGNSSSYHTITDIAPTISVLLQIKFPSGCTGQPVSEALK